MTASGDMRLEPLSSALLRQPLDYILADHLRQRVLCTLCERIAEGPPYPDDAVGQVLAYMEQDMPIHVVDEEEDLFPLLRRRAEPDDDVEKALALLSGEHAADKHAADEIIEGLRVLLDGSQDIPSEQLRNCLRAFAVNQRRHLAFENATVIPLAKARLTEHDLSAFAARMAARRGVLIETAGDRRP